MPLLLALAAGDSPPPGAGTGPAHQAPAPGPEAWAPRVHALNTLRVVLSATELAEDTAGHVPAALAACLDAVSSPRWQVRNAATLAYAALLTRILGYRNDAAQARVGTGVLEPFTPLCRPASGRAECRDTGASRSGQGGENGSRHASTREPGCSRRDACTPPLAQQLHENLPAPCRRRPAHARA